MIGINTAIGGATAVIGVVGFLHIQSLNSTIDALEASNLSLLGQIASCEARQTNIKEDRESDAEVDAMPDLTDVPDRWIMPQAAGTDR